VHHGGYRPNHDPWEYEISEMRILCDKCHGIIHKRRAEFRGLFASLSPANSALLLRIVEMFTSGDTRSSADAWAVYRNIRDATHDLDFLENPPLAPKGKRLNERAIDNALLALPDAVLDPLLDACDCMAELPEKSKNTVLRIGLKSLGK
jgi:hypothetical protein